MRVLVVSQYFWPESFRINDIVSTLIEKGVTIDVLTGKPNYPEGRLFPNYRIFGCQIEQYAGATIFRVPLIPRGKQSAVRLAMNYLSFICMAVIFGSWMLRKRKYDVIFVYGVSPILSTIPAIFIAWLKRRNLIVWVQDLWPESLSATGYVRNTFILHMVEIVVRWIYKHTDLLLVQSRAFIKVVGALAPGKDIFYYPNSVDPAFVAQPNADIPLPKIEALESGFPVVFAGNVGAGQAVEVIVNAAELLKQYPDIHIVVLGQGSRWEWIKQQIELLGLNNLYLPGRYPVDTMPGLMQKAEVLLVTLANEPIFAATVPNKIQAYMASGRPVLACLNGEGARLIEEAGAGLVVPAENSAALAEAILTLYRMTSEQRDAMGRNGRQYFSNNFDHDKLVDELITYFNSLSVNNGEPE